MADRGERCWPVSAMPPRPPRRRRRARGRRPAARGRRGHATGAPSGAVPARAAPPTEPTGLLHEARAFRCARRAHGGVADRRGGDRDRDDGVMLARYSADQLAVMCMADAAGRPAAGRVDGVLSAPAGLALAAQARYGTTSQLWTVGRVCRTVCCWR